ncbi:Fatty acid desaturase, type 1 [Penicillium expansum]|nr:Fatty acid desaturase, type 1 [Penicillium expansum]
MFISLSRVPLTINAKADRRQLRDLATSRSQEDNLAFSLANSVKQEPSTPTEMQLRALWAKVFQVEEHVLGKNDHFLRCGGDFIIAMKLTSHARSAGFSLTVQDIFQTPVLEDMAALISQRSLQDLSPQSTVSWIHGLLHWIVHVWYAGSYTLMKHQYVHMNGVLAPRYRLVDLLFPYIVDPLVGHTWNSYYYHHVKMHHVEGNGPLDLNSTMWYDRDSIADFARYVGRFFFLVSLELPLYFLRKGQYSTSLKTAFWEFSNYLAIALLYCYGHARATICVFILPLMTLRAGLMAGNWGQHAFVDPRDPSSDFRSSITLIDVASNRFCFNDGYHTSHHLHPRRHWREHPVALLRDQKRYSDERALVFQNVDYLMLTVNLLRKNYIHLARCMVPIGAEQRAMSLEERADLLRSRTRRFPELHLERKSASKRR